MTAAFVTDGRLFEMMRMQYGTDAVESITRPRIDKPGIGSMCVSTSDEAEGKGQAAETRVASAMKFTTAQPRKNTHWKPDC